MVLPDKGDNMSNSWGPGGSRWMGQGVEGDENEEGRGKVFEMAIRANWR